jgi:hypothetical protein
VTGHIRRRGSWPVAFHVIRTVSRHFLACWKDLDSSGTRNRGVLSLMRRHHHNLRLSDLLLEKGCKQARCCKLASRLPTPCSELPLLGARAPGARPYAPGET